MLFVSYLSSDRIITNVHTYEHLPRNKDKCSAVFNNIILFTFKDETLILHGHDAAQ